MVLPLLTVGLALLRGLQAHKSYEESWKDAVEARPQGCLGAGTPPPRPPTTRLRSVPTATSGFCQHRNRGRRQPAWGDLRAGRTQVQETVHHCAQDSSQNPIHHYVPQDLHSLGTQRYLPGRGEAQGLPDSLHHQPLPRCDQPAGLHVGPGPGHMPGVPEGIQVLL